MHYSSLDSEDDRLKIEGYNLIRSDHPSGSKKGGVCVYYKEHIPRVRRDDLCTLSNCLITKICLENEKCFLNCLYQSLSQYKFEKLCTNTDTLMDHINNELPICSVITGDLNVKCSEWCKKSITNLVDREIDTLTSSSRYIQIINKSNHTVNNSSSCTDIIFRNNLNLILNYGVDLSLFGKCHHNIIFGKINIQIPLLQSYIHKVWDYSRANAENIQKAVQNFDWEKALENLFVDRKVNLLNETILTISRNYIPNKKIKFNYCKPPSMNENIKRCLKERFKLTKNFSKKGQKREDKEKFEAKASYYMEQIMKAKNNYTIRTTNTLNDPQVAPKTYWSILNRSLYNNKIPAIPPLFVNGKFVSHFCIKANLFNDFLCFNMYPINNGSTMPPFACETNVRMMIFH